MDDASGNANLQLDMAHRAKSPFLSLPLEVRLMIYEYASYVGKPIQPEPVAERSNKFVWGNYRPRRLFNQHGSSGVTVVQESKEPALVAVQLGKTCRQVYDELLLFPVFYRVNHFKFGNFKSMRQFLAALTPPRREMICHIEVSSRNGLWAPAFTVADFARPPRRDHGLSKSSEHFLVLSDALTLLYQCTALRELKLTFDQWHEQQIREVVRQCSEIARLSEAGNGSQHLFNNERIPWSFFHLPQLSINLNFQGHHSGSHRHMINLSDGHQLGPDDFPGLSHDVKAGINKAKQTLLAHRQLVLGVVVHQDDGDQSSTAPLLKGPVAIQDVQCAIQAAGLDFPGENRVIQDRKEIYGPISRRTRSRLNETLVVSNWGTIVGKSEKYDKEGLLVWDVENIQGVRWHEGTIQCEVVACGGEYTAWEELHAIMDRFVVYLLHKYYEKKLTTSRGLKAQSLSAGQRLASLRAMPSPKAVIDAIQSSGGPDNEVYAHTRDWKATVRRWLACEKRWSSTIDHLAGMKGVARRLPTP